MTAADTFNKFFAPEGEMQEYVYLLNVGKVSLPSGRLIAADPLVGLSRDTLPFTRTVPAGEYEVVLCILSEDPRKSYGEYAAARVCFTDRPAVRFEQALIGTEDPAEVRAGVSFGFPVDSGLACFTDPQVCAALCDFEEQMQQQKPDSDLYDDLWCDLLEANARLYPNFQSSSGNWLNFRIPGTDYQLPLFRSGYGDGCYTTYWGVDAEGALCQAVIEFIDPEDEYQTLLRKQARRRFQPEGQQNDGRERIALRMASLRALVGQHPEGHLPLAKRVELYRHIGNPLVVERILCECCKKVYPLWEQYVCRDQSFLLLLRSANVFLYHSEGGIEERRAAGEELVSRAEALSNYANYYGTNARSITAYAIVKLCYSILCRAEDVLKWEEEEYKGQDDNDSDYFDPESLTPDFMAELAYVGQPEAATTARALQRREYWFWFLDMAEALYNYPHQEYLTLPEPAPEPDRIIFKRKQSYMEGSYPLRPLSGMIRCLQEYLEGSDWEKAELVGTVFTGISLHLSILKGTERLTEGTLPESLYKLVTELRKLMYSRYPAEGAWMECRLTITPEGEFSLSMNYDDKDALGEEQSLDTFAAAFAAYPRSRLYTPLWWQNLLSYDSGYLLSPEEKAVMIQIAVNGDALTINNVPLEFPLSPGSLVRLFGEERLVKGYRTATDYDGDRVEYAPTSFLLWNDAGILAARDDEDSYKIAALYLQLLERTESDTAVPQPEHLFSGSFSVNGNPFRYEAGKTVQAGRFEITASESSQGYVEIVYSQARKHQSTSHYYRILMQENCRLTLDDKEHIRTLEKAEARGKEYHPGISNKKLLLQLSKEYLTHALTALTAGYALGKSEKFIRSILLDSLAEAALKRYEYRNIHDADLLLLVSAFVLLNLDKRDFGKFTDKLQESGFRDFVTDTLIHFRLPAWEVSEQTVFPEWKACLTQQLTETATAGPEDSVDDCQQIIRDAILKITIK